MRVAGRIPLLLLLLPLLGCEPWIGEPDAVLGVYYLENLSDDPLVVEAEGSWGDPLELLNHQAAPGETIELYRHVNNASLFPSNTFGQFMVYRDTVGQETLLYDRVHDPDWTMEAGGQNGDGRDRLHYTLSLGEPSEP